MFTAFVDQANWDIAGYEAFDAMCEKYDFDCTYVEQASYEKAPSLLRDYGTKKYDLVVSHSSGYSAAIQEVAPDFPDTQFALFSYETETYGLKNYSAWSVNWDEYGFLQGAVAALASKTGQIAIIGGEKIPSSERSVAYATDGAKYVNPNINVQTAWIGSYQDVAKAKQVGLQAIDAGADVLVPMADLAGQGVQQAAADAGLLTMGEYIDENPKHPKAIVSSGLVDMMTAFDEMGQQLTDGTLGGKVTDMNAATGAISFAPFRNVDAGIEAKAKQLIEDLAAGKITLASR
ncbi:BMP family protein [Frankia sp. EI5c]|uniref:BMP family protein n=1 Tax=Frankia sp. EI5c TaxID=683316 RepID=UPI0037C09C52